DRVAARSARGLPVRAPPAQLRAAVPPPVRARARSAVRRALPVAVAVALVASATAAAADETHGAAQRVTYIERVLAALRATPPPVLAQAANYAQVLNRSSCASEVQRLKVECLMTASRTYCRKKGGDDVQRCAADMDVVVAKLLGDAQLIPIDK